jgi:hypothetical protein
MRDVVAEARAACEGCSTAVGSVKGGEAIQHGHTDLEISDLTVEAPRHKALA